MSVEKFSLLLSVGSNITCLVKYNELKSLQSKLQTNYLKIFLFNVVKYNCYHSPLLAICRAMYRELFLTRIQNRIKARKTVKGFFASNILLKQLQRIPEESEQPVCCA